MGQTGKTNLEILSKLLIKGCLDGNSIYFLHVGLHEIFMVDHLRTAILREHDENCSEGPLVITLTLQGSVEGKDIHLKYC